MKAIGVSQYGPPSMFEARTIDHPGKPKGRELLIQVKAMSVNPIDVKIRGGVYDDAPDYYNHVPKPFHIIGPDGAGVILETGPDARYFKPGDEVFFGSPPIRQGAAAELVLVDEILVGHRPLSWDFVQAATLPVTAGTAWEALHERLGILKNEKAGIFIINGAGGVGSMASQIARNVLKLPVVITTASRPETVEWTKKMGATHVLDHRKDLKKQVDDLKLDVPIKYIFILHSTEQYLSVSSEICAPLGKVCSIVQSSTLNFYGTQFLSKSLTFSWCWLGSRSYHNYDREAQHKMVEEIAAACADGTLKPHLTQRLRLTRNGLQKAHELIEGKRVIGKIGLGVDEEGEGEAFA